MRLWLVHVADERRRFTDLTPGSAGMVVADAAGVASSSCWSSRCGRLRGHRCNFSLSILLWILGGAAFMFISRIISIADFLNPMDFAVIESVTSVLERRVRRCAS